MNPTEKPPLVVHRICELTCPDCGISREGHCSDLAENAWNHKEAAHGGRDVTTVESVKAIVVVNDGDLVTDYDIGSKVREMAEDFDTVEVKFK